MDNVNTNIRVLGVATPEMKEKIFDAQVEHVILEMDNAALHEEIRTRQARSYKAERENRKNRDLSMDTINAIDQIVVKVTGPSARTQETIARIEDKMRKQGRLPDVALEHLRCPLIQAHDLLVAH